MFQFLSEEDTGENPMVLGTILQAKWTFVYWCGQWQKEKDRQLKEVTFEECQSSQIDNMIYNGLD